MCSRIFSGERQIPYAVYSPFCINWRAWSHVWDNVIKYVVNNVISWYPVRSVQFKLIVSFLRNDCFLDVLKADLKAAGRHDLLVGIKTTNALFAKWRMSTLVRNSKQLLFVRDIVKFGFVVQHYDELNESAKAVADLVQHHGSRQARTIGMADGSKVYE